MDEVQKLCDSERVPCLLERFVDPMLGHVGGICGGYSVTAAVL
jgi:hypothetical protein